MGEIFLEKAVGLLASDKQKDRTDGLADLKHVLQQNRHNAKLLNLNDKACHKIFDSLFRVMTIERTAFVRSQRSQARKPSSARISACASVLRIAVDIFYRNLRAKSVRAILDHIIETIPIPGEGLWEFLSVDYTKCLTSLLHYPPHIEHLGDAEWEKLMDFCLAAISVQESDDCQLSIRNGYRSAHEDLPNASDSRSTPSRMTPVPTTRAKYVGDRNAIGEVVVCIQLLTTCPSAPVQAAAENILQCLVKFVKSPSMMAGNAPQLAFSSINAVVSKVLFDQSELVRLTLLELVPVIRRLWTAKSHNLKDELLVTIMFCVVILVDSARRKPSEYLAQLTEGFANTLQSDYTKRSERELLQIDEVLFFKTATDQSRLIYGPRLGTSRSEHTWTLIWAIATLLKLSEDITTWVAGHDSSEKTSTKRQRLTSGVEDVFRDALSAARPQRICALQVVSLLSNDIDAERKAPFFERLIPQITDDNGVVSSWTMIALASIANTPCAKLPSFIQIWPRVAELATRALSSTITSRAACKLLESIITADLLEISDLTEIVRVVLASATLSGPASISDAALDLWALIGRKRTQLNSSIIQNAPSQICTWLREAWAVGPMTNRVQMAHLAMFARPFDLLNLFFACTNRPSVPSQHFPTGPMGPVAKTWLFLHENCEISNYIFDIGTITTKCDLWTQGKAWALETSIQSTQQDADEVVVLELLRSKSEIFVQTWNAMSEDRSQHITADVLQIYASFCIVSALYEACVSQESKHQLQDLRRNCHFLWTRLCDSLADCEPDSMIPILELLSPILPPITSSTFASVSWIAFRSLLCPLSGLLDRQHAGLKGFSAPGDLMDLDDQIPSQGDQESNDLAMLTSNRESTPLVSDNATFHRYMTLRVSILLRAHEQTDVNGRASSSLVAYLTGLNRGDLLSAQSILPKVYGLCSTMERDQLLQILEDLGEKCLQSYEMERCEAAHNLCIRMMTSFVTSWAEGQSDDLNESAADLYNWCMEVLLERKRASSKVGIALSELVQTVLNVCPSYGSDQSLSSPRTSLFNILQAGDMQVKFSVAGFVPTLFGQFLLKDHDAVFDDVLESLPRDPDWVEGIALRLFALSQVASKWHTLLRRSMYHIFETPAQVPDSLDYAKKCTSFVFRALGLHDARELFRLFAPQILYTWMETQNVSSMPFGIFGYGSLQEMLIDTKDEIAGQMIMRGKESEIEELAGAIEISQMEILKTAFHKAEAYSIARDITTPPEQGSQPRGVEIRLRKLLGAEEFMTQIESHFPQIIAIFFKSLDRYDQIERAFSKRPNFHYAMDIQNKIHDKTPVLNPLPANQQPSFRARYLLDEIEFLCQQTGFELEAIWTPTLASFVCRSLLESIHPALGPFHTCSVIRKLKILVCLAGSVMLRDYPYEMLLHALLPFLAETHCSAEALGLFLYLLEAGKQYLIETPGFLAGICISALVSLRKLFWSPIESDTGGSQLNAFVEETRRSYQWLCNFVEGCSSPNWSEETKSSFSQMFALAQKLPESDDKSSAATERQLVSDVLKDRDSASSLLGKPLGDLILSLLCPDFKHYASSRDSEVDFVAEPAHIASLWQTLHQFNGGVEYRLWAAQAIGRSFATSGKINEDFLREQDLSLFKVPTLSEDADAFCFSKASILEILCKKLPIHDNLEAGIIERTLQLILNNVAEFPDFQPCAEVIPESLMKSLIWSPYACPQISLSASETERCAAQETSASGLSAGDWARNISLLLTNAALDDPVIGSMCKILNAIPGLAAQLLPYIVHDVLLIEGEKHGQLRKSVSDIFNQILIEANEETITHAKLVINCVLYLRNQPVPKEATIVERDRWLEIDYSEASSAAHRCGLQKTSLLFLEIQASRVISGSRRSSVVKYEPPIDLMHNVFKNIDDPDLFYGIQQGSSLTTVMERLEYESSGLKNLLFQSAQYDSEIQMSDSANPFGVLKALNSTNLQGIANTMLSAQGVRKDAPVSFDSVLQAATSLQRWDVPISPIDSSPLATVFRAFQSVNSSLSLADMTDCLDDCLLKTLDSLLGASGSAINLRKTMRALGFMTEMSDIVQSTSTENLEEGWGQIMSRSNWLKTESYHEVGEILSWHEALFSSIRKNGTFMSMTDLTPARSRLLEAKVFRRSLEVTRNHGVSQASLKSAISLSRLAEPCAELGLNIDGAAKFDLANVLWDQGEMTASIRMLQQLKGQGDLHKQDIPLSRAELLVTLGHHVAEARLEKPDTILQDYLSPAVKELKAASDGETAGRVYHGFATFCDQQLLNPDGLEDFKRVEQLRDRKEKELLGLEDMMKSAEGRERESLRIFRAKAKQWFDLDDREYQRLLRSREAFLQQSLENYLLALRESDAYNNDGLRFCALWLDKSNSRIANAAVSRYLSQVPSHKFAPLMNQLSSRLLDISDDFQPLLTALVYKICVEHPFHGMYQIFASSKSKGGKDPSSHSRFRAANKLVDRLKNDNYIGPTWVAVHNMNITYVRFAVDKPDSKYKSGAKIALKKLATGERLGHDIVTYKLPPPTMKIELRADKDYSNVPAVAKFSPEFTIASGVSAPKIVTAVATNGIRYKQLYKGGNDDLRQDAIMEQVFEQVSSLLKDHQPTRQRNLGIRTYKVLPLTLNAGIIEFVPNTIPLHDFLMPAHQRYFPKDMKPSACRKHVADVQTRSFEQRVRTYRHVTEHFHPVMKYFFMEKFNNPDDWFSKRLSYTRSTASISILGHVLGLGDRHGHNILLDEKTGEVVHIDLGVAFEQGRILPVPEVVPFRLTRDLVDGFGITKTEGVFRRCCEFTLEALRQDSYSIMTILDVLRYDPLYSWTVSPLRMKKMQDNQEAGDGPPVLPGNTTDKSSTNEPSEADRALTVVAKKLSKTLSVTATVNELIQQATDEKNLAVLYCGWASYA